MSDTIISPRILWKVDLSYLYSGSRSYSQIFKIVYILKSYWKLIIKLDEDWDDYEIYIKPENPEIYMNLRFTVQCGIRDKHGVCRLERLQTLTTETLLSDFIWGASRNLLREEDLLQDNFLHVLCSIEPESNLENYEFQTDSPSDESYCVEFMPCTWDLISDFEYLLNDGLHHDLILECENKIIKAHKNVLSCRSEVFEAMLKGNTKEALEGRAVIRDTPFHIFEKIIRYIYTTEINFENVNIACSIYEEADKFLIASLKERCIIFFKAYLCTSCPKSELGTRVIDACKILTLADYHSDLHLLCFIEDYLANSPILVTPEWCNFSENNPEAAIPVYFKLLKKVPLILGN